MRLDLMTGGSRPWWMRLLLRLARAMLGVVPGPIQVMTYRLELMPGKLRGYILRGMSGHGEWTRSEAELMAAYVSDLNSCHF
jgi:hypothetical protein